MIARLLAAVAAVAFAAAAVAVGPVTRRAGRRMLRAPRVLPEEGSLGPALDGLGGEVVRLRSRDGLRLAARWLEAEPAASDEATAGGAGSPPGTERAVEADRWTPDPREAILLLHGWSGSIAPDLVEYAPFLRQTAGVLGLDFGGHGGSDDAPTTFGLREVEDVAGALEWLGERGIRRVALFGTSMGGMTAIAAAAVLGDGRLGAADRRPDVPATASDAPRPGIVGIVADSVAPELRVVVSSRLPGPLRGVLADRILAGAARELGDDPRAMEPVRLLPLLEDLPVLLVHGAADTTVPPVAAGRLAAAGGPGVEHWLVDGAEHSRVHLAAAGEYETRVTAFLRRCLDAARGAAA